MSVSVRFIYDTPQREVASLLRGMYGRCVSASMVAGFMTVEGIKALARQVRASPAKLTSLVIGAGTLGAFEAFDQLLDDGVQPDRLRVHLGHSRPTNGRAQFCRYHPMLHSKVYFFELAGGTSAAFVGSHNLTRFALYGLNGEAGVLLEGPAGDALFSEIRAHVNAAVAESVQYDPTDRDAYAWWAEQYMQGLAAEFRGLPEEGTAKRTIIILAEGRGPRLPSIGEAVYFEFPKAIGKVQSMSAEVHLYVFGTLPQSPYGALSQLSKARASYLCTTIGLEDDSGGRELDADWQITDFRRPVLLPAQPPFRPRPPADMQQVRVRTSRELSSDFEYLFGPAKPSFEVEFDAEHVLAVPWDAARDLDELEWISHEEVGWYRVKGVRRREHVEKSDAKSEALRTLSPEAGAFILMSLRRRSRNK